MLGTNERVMIGAHTDFDTVLELCRKTPRRIVLGVLADRRESLTVAELADAVAEHERAHSPDAASEEAIRRIQIRLHHVHLPKLEEAGLVEYNARRRFVEPTSEFEQVEPQLAAVLGADSDLEVTFEV